MALRALPITGILLAAGSGSRFSPDGSADKLLMRLPDGAPMALACLRLLQTISERVIAVVRPEAQTLSELLLGAGAAILPCPTAAEGMGTSLAFAARACLAQPSACVVALADMPWIRPATFTQVAAMLALHAAVAPVFEGQRGHPVGFGAALLPALATLSGDEGARRLLHEGPLYRMDCDDPGVIQDIDVPADMDGAHNFYKA
ncbi:MAG: hypothetical protein JWM03_774 [Rhodocyclales bacterium]|nr:hypothetical protein [Rhodocyclales bacterium]